MQGTMPVDADGKPLPIDDSFLDNIENMVAHREVNDDEVEHLLSERLLEGFLLLERACPSCTTPLVKQPLDHGATVQPCWTPTESQKAISIIQKMHSHESPRQAPAPIPGVPFCVYCKAHVVTHESEVQHLDSEHNTMKHQGKILVDLLPRPSPEEDMYEHMYETTTITSTSTQFQPAALRQQTNIDGNSCTAMSTRTARTNSSGLLALAASSLHPTPTTQTKTKTRVKSTVMPPTLNEEKSIVPGPDDNDHEAEEEIEVSIKPPTPMAMAVTPQLPSPAASPLPPVAVSEDQALPVAISDDQGPQQQEQKQQQNAIISSDAGGDAVTQAQKKVVEDHEDDALIEIEDEDDTEVNSETYEVTHISKDKDVVEGSPHVEHTIEKTPPEMTDSPPVENATPLTLTSEETDVASIYAAQIDMALSNLEAESPAAPVDKSRSSAEAKEMLAMANTNVQPEPTPAEQIPHSTSATADNNETVGEEDDDLPEYNLRRDIATKVLAGKMMQGYSLTEQQCEKCSMPQVEYEGKLECAVCPALKKRALKSREKEQRRLEQEVEKKRLADQKHKIELEIRLKRIADSEVKVEQEAEKQRLAEQETEQERLIKLQTTKQQLVEEEAEKQRLVKVQAEKQRLAEQESEQQRMVELQAKRQRLVEQEIVSSPILVNQEAKLDDPGGEQGSVRSQFTGVRTIRRTKTITPTPMIGVNTEVEVRTIRRTPRSTPTPMVENHDSLLQVAPQPLSLDPAAIAPPSPTKVVELEAEEARLLAELQKSEEETEFQAGNDAFRVKEAKINEAIKKGNELVLQETRRLQELEKHRIEAMQMPAKGMLADLSAHEQRKMREREAMLRKEIEAAEKARDEATLEARRLADKKRAMEEARLLVALEEEATTKQTAAEKALENAKSARDHVASARRGIIAKTIADGDADAVAEAERITRAEREDYYEQVILPTASALRRESWETLRAEGRSVMTRRIMAGWTLLPEFCRGAECESSPLLCKHATKMCVVCGGDGSGANGAYSLPDDDEMDFDDEMTKDSSIRPPLEISTFDVITPVTVEIQDTTGPSNLPSAFDTKRNMVCKSLIGKQILEGWTLIDMACPHCVMPLMTTPEGIGEVCVLCGPVSLSKQEEIPAEVSVAKEAQAVESAVAKEAQAVEPAVAKETRGMEPAVAKEAQAVVPEIKAQSELEPLKKPLSLMSRIRQLDNKVEKSLIWKTQQSPRIKQLGIDVESSPFKMAQSPRKRAQSPRIRQLGINVENSLVKTAQSPRAKQSSPVRTAQSPRIKRLGINVESSIVKKAQSPRFKQSGINLESSLVKKAQSPRFKQLGINVEKLLVKQAQSPASKYLDKSASLSSDMDQFQSLIDDKSGHKKKSVSSRIKQYLSAAVGKNISTKGQSAESAKPETEQKTFTAFKGTKSVSSAKLDALEKPISSRSMHSYSTRDSTPSRVKQSNSSAERFATKSEKPSVSVKLDEIHNSVDSGVVEQLDPTAGKSIGIMAQSVARVAQLVVSDKQDAQQLDSISDRGAVSQVSANSDDPKKSFSSKIKQYLNTVEELVEDQESTTEMLAVEKVKSAVSADPDDQVKSVSSVKLDNQSMGSKEAQSAASAESLDSFADESFLKDDQTLSSSHTTDDRYASLHATPSEISVKGVYGRFEGEAAIVEAAMAEAAIVEEVDEDTSPYYRPAHLFTTTKSLHPRTRGDPPALQCHANRRSNAVDPEDSRSPTSRLHFLQHSEPSVEENKHRTVIEAVPKASVEASPKQMPTDSPADPPQDSAEVSAGGSLEESATQTPEESRNSTEQMTKNSPKQTQAAVDSPGEPPKDSDSVQAEGPQKKPAKQTSVDESRNDTELIAKILISTEETPKESLKESAEASPEESPNKTPKESPKQSPKEPTSLLTTGTSMETLDNDSTKDSATSATQRKSNKLFDRIEYIKERRERILARKLQINASNSDSESERSSEPTFLLDIPKGFDMSDKHSSRRSSNSVKGRDAPPLGIDTGAISRHSNHSVNGRDAPPLGIDTGASVHRSVMHLPSPGMAAASFPKPFFSPGAASDRSSATTPSDRSSATTPSGMMSASRPRITPEDGFRSRSSSRQRGDSVSVSNSKAVSSFRNERPSASTKSTPSHGLPRNVQRDVLPGKFRGHSKSKQSVQPEVIVIGGPFDRQTKAQRSSRGLASPTGGDDASIGSTTLDSLLGRIEETKAQLEEAPSTTNRLEQQARLKSLIETLTAAADEVERKELDCLSE